MQKQISAYSGDVSEETRANVQELKVSLEEAKTNLEETEYDKYISDQKKLLDDLYDEYERILNLRLDDLDALIADMIDTINGSAVEINTTIFDAASDVGYTLSESMASIWGEASKAQELDRQAKFNELSGYLQTLVDNGKITEEIKKLIQDAFGKGDPASIEETKKLLNELVKNGVITQSDADSISATISKAAEEKVAIEKYKAEQEKKSTTNDAINDIVAGVNDAVQAASQTAQNNLNELESGSKQSASTMPQAKEPAKPAQPAPAPQPAQPQKPVRTDRDYYGVALAIWNGNYGWGNFPGRRDRLEEKGFDYQKTQNIVNQMGREGYIRSGAWEGRYQGIRSKDLPSFAYSRYRFGSRRIDRDQLAWTQEDGTEFIIRRSDGSVLTPLAKSDSVLTAAASDNIWNMANNPERFIKDNLGLGMDIGATPITVRGGDTFGDIAFSLTLPNVTNYEQFRAALVKDKSFERMVKSVTVDRIFGGSKLKKYRV